MFTGLVEEVGTVISVEGSRLAIGSHIVLEGTAIGDSIAVNGCCLTVTELVDDGWAAEVVDETYDKTNLSELQVGSRVNLERPVAVGSRLGGHIVQGHVDGVGVVVESDPFLKVSLAADLAKYVVAKGSVAIDGVSLTVVSKTVDGFCVALIPHTKEVTVLGTKTEGSTVNVEVDLLAKYVENLLGDVPALARASGKRP